MKFMLDPVLIAKSPKWAKETLAYAVGLRSTLPSERARILRTEQWIQHYRFLKAMGADLTTEVARLRESVEASNVERARRRRWGWAGWTVAGLLALLLTRRR